jgi:hypothetical protein
MRIKQRRFTTVSLAGVALFLPVAFAQQPGQGRGPGQQPPDPQFRQRTYHFNDTNEDFPYAVFLSSKVTKDKKNPLIIALHGLGGTQNSLMRGNALDFAEGGGYILVGHDGLQPTRMVRGFRRARRGLA